MELEVRICPSCKREYKCLPTSKQVFCSRRCIEFRDGKQNRLSGEELMEYKRMGIVSLSKKFPGHLPR
jgi:hypothetical protein